MIRKTYLSNSPPKGLKMERITAGTLIYIRKFKWGILYFTCRTAVKSICYDELEALPSRTK